MVLAALPVACGVAEERLYVELWVGLCRDLKHTDEDAFIDIALCKEWHHRLGDDAAGIGVW